MALLSLLLLTGLLLLDLLCECVIEHYIVTMHKSHLHNVLLFLFFFFLIILNQQTKPSWSQQAWALLSETDLTFLALEIRPHLKRISINVDPRFQKRQVQGSRGSPVAKPFKGGDRRPPAAADQLPEPHPGNGPTAKQMWCAEKNICITNNSLLGNQYDRFTKIFHDLMYYVKN